MKKKFSPKKKPAALVFALCVIASGAQAVDLGKLVIYSHLSEPLSASVALGAGTAEDLDNVVAKIGSADLYAAAGMKRPVWIDAIVIKARLIDKDRLELRLSTPMPVEDPASSLIIEVSIKDQEQSMSREYAVILDPVEMQKSIISKAPKPAANGASDATGSVVVKSGQILYAIAKSKRDPDVSVERMMIGLLKVNPNAFVDNNINRLKSGAILRMPSRPEIEAIAQADAMAQVNAQTKSFSQWRSKALASAAGTISSTSSQSASGKIAKATASPEGEKDGLTLGKPGLVSKSSGQEKADAIAKQKELEEANSKLKDLERMRSDLQKLLTLRDKQLAEAQEAAKKNVQKPVAAAEEKKPVAAAEEKKPVAADEEKKPVAADEEKKPEPEAEEHRPEPVAEVKKPKPLPTPIPEPIAEPSMMDAVMGALSEYGVYLAGLLLAVIGGVAFAVKRRGRKGKMRATTISPEIDKELMNSDTVESNTPTAFEEHINSADTFIAFGQPEKAMKELEEALKLSPGHIEALIRLARIAAQQSDRGALGKHAAAIGDATFKSGHYWEEVDELLSKFAKSDEVPAQNPTQNIDLSIDLERSLMDLAADEALGVQTAPDMDFNVNVQEEKTMAAAPKANVEALVEPSFELPSFDMGDIVAKTPEKEPAKKVEPPGPGMEFDSMSFDLSLPDDKPSLGLDSTSESLDFNVVPPQESAESDADGELKTMLELARAYLDMGDRDGAKELLVEIANNGTPSLSAQAKQMMEGM